MPPPLEGEKCQRQPDPTIVAALALLQQLEHGAFHPDRALNQQRAIVQLIAANMDVFHAKTYRFSLKRMTEGAETVPFWG
jgi:hypothetical protein